MICIVVIILVYALFKEPQEENEPEDNPKSEPNMINGNYPYTKTGLPETANFKLKEFDCNDGTPVPPMYYGNVYTLMQNLQVLRNEIGLPIVVNSGYRTPSHNAKISGAENSQHKYAKAGDIRVAGMTPRQVYNKIESLIASGKMRNGGLGLYGTFVHYDVRSTPARWRG